MKLFKSYSEKELKRIEPLKQKTLDLESRYQGMDDKTLKEQTSVLRSRLESGETLQDVLPDAFAVMREAMWRVISIKPYPVQIIGGIVLHQGRISEMKTGEGKTFVAALPAYLNALTGKGVHVVTVNDYLAKYGSELIGRVFRFLGMTVGLISQGEGKGRKREHYECDITYGTNNEFGFDYLRDNMCVRKEDKVQRPHHYAIVDEVDSILIDEARTPLIISGHGDKSTDLYERANRLARSFKAAKVVELDSKEDHDHIEGDYIVDEKAKSATLLPSGVKKAEAFFGLNDDNNLMEVENLSTLHHVNQAIKAYGIMKRDVDYVVKDGEIIIVDVFTGRLMIGRRFNEGLHQAIEAKEGVKIKNESKTLATITFQNYFRLYEKLSGMTGTAMTEEEEFRGIYGLDVVEIPTNKPAVRKDHNDQIYKTENGKYGATVLKVEECHKKGQPILVGTTSIEKSELISKLLKKKGIKHEVLNAKNHAREAEIVAQAGKKDAVTIATNMAGRGTDIMLGGNAEYLARAEMRKRIKKAGTFTGTDNEEDLIEQVIYEATGFAETDNQDVLKAREDFKELFAKYKKEIEPEADEVLNSGGLFILGTERHESRRIDNQLRGRAGRQGDSGESQFFLSLEDDLMRLFGGERISGVMNTLGVDEDVPIENRILSRTIENAQRKVEARNFSSRKQVLEFDDVMSQMRTTIYAQRGKVLDDEDIGAKITEMLEETVTETVNTFCQGDAPDDWNLTGLREHFRGFGLTTDGDFMYPKEEMDEINRNEIEKELMERSHKRYTEQEELFTSEIMRKMERDILLKCVDTRWMEHIDAMSDLKQGIYMRTMGTGKQPIVEYRHEGFSMYDEMIASIREDTVRMILTVRKQTEREQVMKALDGAIAKALTVKKKQSEKIGANEPCHCGSGKKFKKCCGIASE
ncbi:MAG: preprotein translocase subunit SecA [Oscillospiraceae bacterium]|nr:preprotein translocase subunit SecA [Oscillospiraceae bacterium]